MSSTHRYQLEGEMRVRVAMSEGDGAKWNLLFPLGATRYRSDFPKGKVTFDKAFLASLADNFAKMAKRHQGEAFALQLNYLHPEPGQPVENHRAAGWIEDVDLRTEGEAPGLYVLVKWTEEARGFIQADGFRYLSPEFSFDAQDSETGKRQGPTLWGAALLNTPFLKELPRVAASQLSEQSNPPDESGSEGAARMDKKQVCAALGMPEDSSDEQVMEKLKSLMAPKEEEKPEEKAEEMKAAEQAKALKLSEAEGAVVKLAAENKALTERLTALETEKKSQDVKAFFDELIRQGRCTPSIREGFERVALTLGLEAVKFLEAAPPMVKLGEVGVAGEAAPEDKKAAAQKRWDAKLSELQSKGAKYTEAMELAKAALREDFEALFG